MEERKAIGIYRSGIIYFVISFLSVSVCGLTAQLMPGFISTPSRGAVCGIVVLFISLTLFLSASFLRRAGRRVEANILCALTSVLDYTACGLLISEYYAYTGSTPSFSDTSLCALVFALVILLTVLMTAASERRLFGFISAGICAVGTALCALGWIKTGEPVFSFSFFLGVMLVFHCIAISFLPTGKSIYRYSAIASFGPILIAGIVAIVIISEGDPADALKAFNLSDEEKEARGVARRGLLKKSPAPPKTSNKK